MADTFSIGLDYGAAAVRSSNYRLGAPQDIALIDSGRRWRAALTPSSVWLNLVTDERGVEVPGGVLTADENGELPLYNFVVEDITEVPPFIWLHPEGAPIGEGWRRYATGSAEATDMPGGPTIPLTEYSVQDKGFRWNGDSLVAGKTTPPWPVRYNARVTRPCQIRALGGVPSADVVVQFRKRSDDTGLVTDLGEPVVLPAGQTVADGPAINQDVAPGSVTATLVSPPPPGVPGTTPATVVAGSDFTSGGASTSSYVLPEPAGGVAGDLVVVMVASQGAGTSMPSGWTEHVSAASVISGTQSPYSRCAVFSAPWTDDLDMTLKTVPFTTGGGNTIGNSPVLARVALLRGVDLDAPVVASNQVSPANASGPSIVIPAMTPAADTDLVYKIAAWRVGSGISGQTADIAPSADVTETSDQMTTRDPVSNTNIGLATYRMAGTAAGVAIPSHTVTVSGGTGSLTVLTMTAATVAFRRAPDVTAPQEINAWIWFDVPIEQA